MINAVKEKVNKLDKASLLNKAVAVFMGEKILNKPNYIQADCIKKKWCDLTIVYGMSLGEIDDEYTAYVYPGLWFLKQFDVTEEEFINAATENIKKQIKYSTLDDAMMETIGLGGKEYADVPTEGFPILLTNKAKNGGAIYITYDDIATEIADAINDDFIVLPSSIHEVMIYPYKELPMPISDALQMVREINANGNITGVGEKEFLSDNLYFYDKEAKSWAVIAEA